MDGDGDLEILVGDQVLGSPVNRMYAWHHDGAPVAGWPTPGMYAVFAQAVVADLDGNGDQEIVWDDNTEFADGTGRLRGYHHDGRPILGWPLETAGTTFLNTPSVGDVDSDGDLELLQSCGASLEAFTTVYLWDLVFRSFLPPRSNAYHVEMPMYQYGPGHHGRYGGYAATQPKQSNDHRAATLMVGANPVPADGTTIQFAVPAGSRAGIAVFDVEGRLRRRIDPGSVGETRTITFDARDDSGRPLPSGSYWIQLTVDGEKTVRRIVHLR